MDVKLTLLAAMMAAGLLFNSCGRQAQDPFAQGNEACGAESCNGAETEAELNAPVPGTVEEIYEPGQLGGAREAYEPPPFDAEWGLPQPMYEKAVQYYRENISLIENTRYLTIVDFSKWSTDKRFYLFDLKEGKLERHNTSHGVNSDPDKDGYATDFSNEIGSRKSSLGFYLTLGTYTGKNGHSMRIRGLEESNSNAETRAVVVHPARYVNNSRNKAGFSWGCPALDPKVSRKVIDRIKAGSLLLIDQ